MQSRRGEKSRGLSGSDKCQALRRGGSSITSGADPAAVPEWVKGGPRKATVLSDRVEVAAESPEARGYRVADREMA